MEQVAVEFDQPIDENAFCASVQHVIRSHEAFRVKFDWSQPEHPTQQVEQDLVLPVRTVQADGESELEQMLSEERERVFDFSQPSQMREQLFGLVCNLRNDNCVPIIVSTNVELQSQ